MSKRKYILTIHKPDSVDYTESGSLKELQPKVQEYLVEIFTSLHNQKMVHAVKISSFFLSKYLELIVDKLPFKKATVRLFNDEEIILEPKE